MATEEDNNRNKSERQTIFYAKNASDNSPNINESDGEFVEVYDTEVKIAFVTLACVSVMSSLTAISFMHRSKKIPYATKLLSTGLLSFDVAFIVTSTLRKFITDHIISLNIQTMVTIYLQLAGFTVGLMSIERYILISKPMLYDRFLRKKYIRTIVLSIWLFDVCLCLVVRYGVCYVWYRTRSVFNKTGFCNSITSGYYGILLFIVLTTSCTCYVKMFLCIRTKLTPGDILSVAATARRMRMYRSTSLVFLYLIVIAVSSVAYGIIIILIQIKHLQYTRLRLAVEAVSIFNCIIDPFLYVFWFKECRLQLMLILAMFLKRYRQKAEQMRIQVYDIVTKEVKSNPVSLNMSLKVSYKTEALSEVPNAENEESNI